jgi:hypothetical protein
MRDRHSERVGRGAFDASVPASSGVPHGRRGGTPARRTGRYDRTGTPVTRRASLDYLLSVAERHGLRMRRDPHPGTWGVSTRRPASMDLLVLERV